MKVKIPSFHQSKRYQALRRMACSDCSNSANNFSVAAENARNCGVPDPSVAAAVLGSVFDPFKFEKHPISIDAFKQEHAVI